MTDWKWSEVEAQSNDAFTVNFSTSFSFVAMDRKWYWRISRAMRHGVTRRHRSLCRRRHAAAAIHPTVSGARICPRCLTVNFREGA